jgi:hypothetical protein
VEEEGESEIVQINLSDEDDRAVYSEIKNNPDRYEVIQETDFGGRGEVLTVLRYVRKGPWKPNLRHQRSYRDSARGSRKQQNAPARKKVAGFAVAVKKKKDGKSGSPPDSAQPPAPPAAQPGASGTISTSISRTIEHGRRGSPAVSSPGIRSGSGTS